MTSSGLTLIKIVKIRQIAKLLTEKAGSNFITRHKDQKAEPPKIRIFRSFVWVKILRLTHANKSK